MELKNKNILLISPEPWEHIFVSKHHYATHLAARGNKVYFLNPPTAQKLTMTETKYKGMFLLDYIGFVKGLRVFPKFIQRRLMRKKFNELQEQCKTSFDIVWSFDNSVFFDFDALPGNVLKICHIVDLNQNFETARAASTADVCFGTTKHIVKRLGQYNNNTHFINHGYNAVKQPEEIRLIGKNQVKVVYAGNLDIAYIDWITINKIVKNTPTVDFLFIGKKETENTIFKQSNVYHLGVLPAHQLPSYYMRADVLMLCYNAEEYSQQLANPHKMMEYLGSGKTVLATKTLEYEGIANKGLIAMSNKNEEFSSLFHTLMNDLENWNSDEKSQQRITYALDNTYDKQIDKIEALIKEHVS